ncbi:hypothetical protein SBF1_8910002 [Candidatus Desulfosporosinus infrequens]|uniref:Uncharacterized protein n=1 Tax=Candidatus Desulfosporosinus infrequens TaxID=2043169 RepID=A0A2U3LWE2_9FIRM|nr:hypothetical protein SBF1_8910002 [Candidatus Desulfosporosinus infrequens]
MSGDGYVPQGNFYDGDIVCEPGNDATLMQALVVGVLCNNEKRNVIRLYPLTNTEIVGELKVILPKVLCWLLRQKLDYGGINCRNPIFV